MPSPSTDQDEQANPRPLTVEGLFDSSPMLEDTRPFSLLNALLADVPGAVHYQAPAFQVPEVAEVADPPAGQLAAALLKQSRTASPTPEGETNIPTAEAHSTPSEDRTSQWPGASDALVEDAVTEESATEAKPKAFPKWKDSGAPEKPKSWPKRGFVSSATRSKASTDPLHKAIRIFESLSSPELKTHTDIAAPVGEEVVSPGELPSEAPQIEPAKAAIESPAETAASAAPTELVQLEAEAECDLVPEPALVREEVSPLPTVVEGIDAVDQPTALVASVDPADQPTAPVGGIDPADQPTAPIGLKPPTFQAPAPVASISTEDKATDNIGIDVDGDAATQPIRLRGPLAANIAPQDEPANAWSLNAARVFLSNSEVRQETVNDKVASLLEILETVLPRESASTNKAVSNDNDDTRPYQVPPAPKPKIKLAPHKVKDKGDLDITAPVTVVAPETPVSPFTKIAPGTTKEVRPNPGPPPQKVTTWAKPPQPPSGAITAGPPVPKAAESSPFSVIDRATQETPLVKETPKPQPNPDFASPFSSAMKRRVESSPTTRQRPTMVAPITPPGELPDDAESLPLPTYSFSSLEEAPAVTSTRVPSRGKATPKPTKAARSAPSTTTIEQEPERAAWGFLTILLACIFVGFLLLYIIEIYKELRSPRMRMPTPIPPDAEEVIPAETSASAETPTPLSDVDLNEPLEAIKAFLSARTIEARLPFVLEDESVAEPMRRHYASFGGLDEGLPDTMAIVDGGTLPGTNREFVTARLHWKTHDPLNIRLIRQEGGKHQFSWYAFEQGRHQLFVKFVIGEWEEWSHFYVEIRPSEGPSYVPEMVRKDSLWYQVASPEYPDFTMIAGVSKDSPIAKDFAERFQADRKYEVIAELERARDEEGMILDHLKIVRLLNDSWAPVP